MAKKQKIRPTGAIPDRMSAFANQGAEAEPAILQDGLKYVSTDRIMTDPNNERKTFTDLEGLAASIKNVGVLDPLLVSPMEGGRFLLLAGERRLRACRLAELEQVPVIVKSGDSDTTRRVKSLVSNIQREDVPPLEMARGVQTLIEEYQLSQVEVANRIGKSKVWVNSILRVLDLPAPLLEAVGSKKVSYDSLIEVARLDDREAQAELIDDVVNGASRTAVREKIRTHKGLEPKSSAGGTHVTVVGDVVPSKPRMKFVTKKGNSAVIIQSLDRETLSPSRQVVVLQEALRQAKARLKNTDAANTEIVSAAD